ncbi:UPF0688 protein C1orf174 homolog [Hemiscyllium ocellatum]|uniref:UPF0688 protein C1orf174 homolog n=1 Tax=Hemiscyllium ocellatum TaxID=170820 RepID=UPI002965D97E|nr:UPF0688 protein C1orf174 homolog [Hemiscyllium ocellatum]
MKTKQVGIRRSARIRNRELCSIASNTSNQDVKDDSSVQKTTKPFETLPIVDKVDSGTSDHPSKKQKCERVEVQTQEKTGATEQDLEDSAIILPHKPSHKSTEQTEKPLIHEDCTQDTPVTLENEVPSTTTIEWSNTEKQREHAAVAEEPITNNGSSTEIMTKTMVDVVDKGLLESKEDIEKTVKSDNDAEKRNIMEIDQPPGTSFKVDSSIFLDEDSNQPMPVGKFFGNVEIMQDLPQSVPLLDSATRREYRRRHFIAKDEEDEELEDKAVNETAREPRSVPPSETEVPVGTETKVNSVQQNTPDIVEKCL